MRPRRVPRQGQPRRGAAAVAARTTRCAAAEGLLARARGTSSSRSAPTARSCAAAAAPRRRAASRRTPRNTVGAGDAFIGVLLARLAHADFYPPAIAAALPEAVAGGRARDGAMGRGRDGGVGPAAPGARGADPRPPARDLRPPRRAAAPRSRSTSSILTVLSQSTNDRNRDVAFLRLRERFASWEAVRDAPVEEVEEAIRPGGISKVKSERIQEILRAIGDPLDARRPRGRARSTTPARGSSTLPGVGRKTAACVLLFSLRDARRAGRHARLARRRRAWSCCARARASTSCTTRCSRSRRRARSSSCTSTSCATAAAPATRASRTARRARCGGCARALPRLGGSR